MQRADTVERDARVETSIHDDRDGIDSYSIWTMLYTYVDERLDTNITILYPKVSMPGVYEDAEMQKLQDSINDQIRDAFFIPMVLMREHCSRRSICTEA